MRPSITFALTQYTERVDGRNYPRIWLTNKPVVEVISISVNGALISNDGGFEWTLDPNQGELLRSAGQYNPRFAPWWQAGRRNIEVVYTAGYDPIPNDVQRATVMTMQALAAMMVTSGIYQSE